METLRDLFQFVVDTYPARKVLLRTRAGKGFRELTVREFETATRDAAGRLSKAGVKPGDRIALFAENRPEWHVIDFACYLLGAVNVPIYATLPASQVAYIVADCGADILLVSGRERTRTAQDAIRGLPGIRLVGIDQGLADGVEGLADLPKPGRRERIEPPRLTIPVVRFAVIGIYGNRTPAWIVK